MTLFCRVFESIHSFGGNKSYCMHNESLACLNSKEEIWIAWQYFVAESMQKVSVKLELAE